MKYRFICIGDLILDEFITGISSRISPEAPVPVVNFEKSECMLGGSGNVSKNISNLSKEVYQIGFIAKNNVGNKIYSLLSKANIKFDKKLCISNYQNPHKIRIRSKNQQIVRLDEEYINHEISIRKIETICNSIKSFIFKNNFFLISDYGKGFINNELINRIKLLKKKNDVLIIDPRKKINDYSIYKGVDFITPNFEEIKNLYPTIKNVRNDLVHASKDLIDKYDIKNVIITRGEKGILLVNNNEIFECKTKVREVYDVSGAGDTVIATFAYSLSKGISIRDSLNISNECAGYVITLPGTTPISRSDYSKIKKNIIKN